MRVFAEKEIFVTVRITDKVDFGSEKLFLIAGPCVIESREHAMKMAGALVRIADRLGLPFVYKSSYDKANRTSVDSFRGVGAATGLKILDDVRREFGVPVLTDVHSPDEATAAGRVVDVIQIPAFLARQTDLLVAAGKTGKTVNIKKAQFMAPENMRQAIDKVVAGGGERIVLTERGTSFGYSNLVSDMRSIVVMRATGCPVCFDGTHSVQYPSGEGTRSGGDRRFVPALCRAAVAAGADGVFLEVHDDPDSAPCDGPNMLRLDDLERLLATLVTIRKTVFDRLEGACPE